jgi:hypothetical protein
LRKAESSTLKECGEEKARGMLQSQMQKQEKKGKLLPFSTFFFSFLLLEKKKMPRRKRLK